MAATANLESVEQLQRLRANNVLPYLLAVAVLVSAVVAGIIVGSGGNSAVGGILNASSSTSNFLGNFGDALPFGFFGQLGLAAGRLPGLPRFSDLAFGVGHRLKFANDCPRAFIAATKVGGDTTDPLRRAVDASPELGKLFSLSTTDPNLREGFDHLGVQVLPLTDRF